MFRLIRPNSFLPGVILRRTLTSMTTPTTPVPVSIAKPLPPPPPTMRAVVADGSGGAKLVVRPTPTPLEHELLLRVEAASVNRADLMQLSGNYPPPPDATDILGLEAVGLLPDGTRVAALLVAGGLAEYVIVPRNSIFKLPTQLPPVMQAAIPEAFVAAYHVLFECGAFAPGQTVLVHAAASGVGTALIQLARTVPDAVVVATAGSSDKLAMCTSLGAHHVVNYREASFADMSMVATAGRGVDLVLDCVGVSHFNENIRALRPEGRWVLYGLLSGARSPQLGLAGLLKKRLTIIATTLRGRDPTQRAAIVNGFASRFAHEFGPGRKLKPIIDRQFDGIETVPEALRYLQSNKTIGTLVVRFDVD